MSREHVGIFVAEMGQALLNGRHQDGEALGDRFGFAWEIDDETVASDASGGAREDGRWHLFEGRDAHDFAETG
jgi:hypothetical protein